MLFMLPPRGTAPRLTECLSFIQKRPRASQGTAVRSSSPQRYYDAMPKTLKSWSRCVGRLERWSGISPPTPRRGPQCCRTSLVTWLQKWSV